jgi:hypothetical protein
MRVYRVPKDSDVGRVIAALEEVCKKRGLILSRWETGSKRCGWIRTITWAAHRGPRTSRFCNMPESAVDDYMVLTSPEGKTKRCAAYKLLLNMLFCIDHEDFKVFDRIIGESIESK